MSQPNFSETNRTAVVGARPYYEGDDTFIFGQAEYTTNVLYTVATGKVLLILASNIVVRKEDAIQKAGYFDLRNGSDVIKFRFGFFESAAIGGVSETVSYYPPLPAAAGWDLTAVSTGANCVTYGSIYGVLVDA